MMSLPPPAPMFHKDLLRNYMDAYLTSTHTFIDKLKALPEGGGALDGHVIDLLKHLGPLTLDLTLQVCRLVCRLVPACMHGSMAVGHARAFPCAYVRTRCVFFGGAREWWLVWRRRRRRRRWWWW